MAFWLLLLMLTACAAYPDDLTGKMFTFPEETDEAHVKLLTSETSLTAITVCLRFKTDLTRNHALFSLATTSNDNAFLIFKRSQTDLIEVHVDGKRIRFEGQDFKLNTWHSICSTWDENDGVVDLWLDGKSTIKKYVGGPTILAPTMLLGQEQDSLNGGFSQNQSFLGMICDVHVWKNVLSPCEILRFMSDTYFTPGNVVNWKALDYEKTGRVLKENKKIVCFRRRYFPHYPKRY